MRKTWIAAMLAWLTFESAAQTTVSRVYVKGGKDAWENYMKEVYLNAQFEEGVVEYRNGQRYKGLLNYNKALGSVQFISEQGDTLVINDETAVRRVTIGEQLFYLQPVCLQVVSSKNSVTLAKNERVRIADKQKMGAMGIPNSQATIDSYDRSNSRNNHFIDINEQLLIRKTSTYYMESADRSFSPASKKEILQLFPNRTAEVKKYIAENAVDFNREDDLIRLTEFLGTL